MRREAEPIAASFELNLGALRATLSRPPSRRPDYDGVLSGLLEVLVDAASRVPVLLVIDEFSAVAALPGVAAKFRTALQHHYERLGIVFAGSEPSTMALLFTDRAQPFYAQADLVRIEPLTRAAVTAIVAAGFTATDRDAGVAPSRTADLTGGHPHRAMQLADHVWRETPEAGTVDEVIWAAGLDALRRTVEEEMRRTHVARPTGHQRVLRLIAHDQSPHGRYAGVVDLGKSAATAARDALVAAGDLGRTDDGYTLTDPLYRDWLRRTFPL